MTTFEKLVGVLSEMLAEMEASLLEHRAVLRILRDVLGATDNMEALEKSYDNLRKIIVHIRIQCFLLLFLHAKPSPHQLKENGGEAE